MTTYFRSELRWSDRGFISYFEQCTIFQRIGALPPPDLGGFGPRPFGLGGGGKDFGDPLSFAAGLLIPLFPLGLLECALPPFFHHIPRPRRPLPFAFSL